MAPAESSDGAEHANNAAGTGSMDIVPGAVAHSSGGGATKRPSSGITPSPKKSDEAAGAMGSVDGKFVPEQTSKALVPICSSASASATSVSDHIPYRRPKARTSVAQTSHTQLLTDPLEPLSKSFAEIASPSGSLSLVPADDSTESHAASFTCGVRKKLIRVRVRVTL